MADETVDEPKPDDTAPKVEAEKPFGEPDSVKAEPVAGETVDKLEEPGDTAPKVEAEKPVGEPDSVKAEPVAGETVDKVEEPGDTAPKVEAEKPAAEPGGVKAEPVVVGKAEEPGDTAPKVEAEKPAAEPGGVKAEPVAGETVDKVEEPGDTAPKVEAEKPAAEPGGVKPEPVAGETVDKVEEPGDTAPKVEAEKPAAEPDGEKTKPVVGKVEKPTDAASKPAEKPAAVPTVDKPEPGDATPKPPKTSKPGPPTEKPTKNAPTDREKKPARVSATRIRRAAIISGIAGAAIGLGGGAVLFGGGNTECIPCEAAPPPLPPAAAAPPATDTAVTATPVTGATPTTPRSGAAAATTTIVEPDPIPSEPCSGEPVQFRDEDFGDGWSGTIVVNSPKGWTIEPGFVGQNLEGSGPVPAGNPAPSRWVWYGWQGEQTPANVTIAHESVKSAISGPISSVRFSLDAHASSVLVTPLIIQGNTYYAANGVTADGTTGWIKLPSDCLTEGDFRNVAGPGPATPDFAQPMTFGYTTASTSHRTDGRDLRISVVDNWQVEVWS